MLAALFLCQDSILFDALYVFLLKENNFNHDSNQI